MKLEDLVQVSSAVAGTSSRLAKISRLAELFTRIPPDDIPIAVGFLTGWPRQGKLGVGWAGVSRARECAPANEATLDLRDVDNAFDRLLNTTGKKSGTERQRILTELFSRATQDEQSFLGSLIIGEVRQGALEGVLLEAIAKASGLPSNNVRRAAMMAGNLGVVAQAALRDGEAGLSRYQLEVFRPVQPMLADSAETVADAMSSDIPVAIEWKLDGARIQVHRSDDRVAIYTRNLNNVTDALPEVVEAIRTLPARELILDGEVIAL